MIDNTVRAVDATMQDICLAHCTDDAVLGRRALSPSDKRAFGDSEYTTRGKVTYDGRTLFLDWENQPSAWTFLHWNVDGR